MTTLIAITCVAWALAGLTPAAPPCSGGLSMVRIF